MEEYEEKYIKAGRIAAAVREEAARMIRPGMSVLELCEWVERKIMELGARPAFPCNLSINEVAAHYTPPPGDTLRIPEESVVKLDLGVHVDGYIADTAVTVSLSPLYDDLLEASRTALERALESVRPGARFSEIGRIIEDTIKSYGYKPIKNLSGHSLGRFLIHSGESIPNYHERLVLGSFKPGRAYAIEPFATNGAGYVREGSEAHIYAIVKPRAKGLSSATEKVLRTAYQRFRTLPFTSRWLQDLGRDVDTHLRVLVRRRIIYAYPVLVEAAGGMVSQFEHTVLITGSKDVIITTKP